MKLRLCIILIVCFLGSSCEAEYKPPYLLYTAQFDITKVDNAVVLVKEIAKNWNLRVYEIDREQMKFVTQGKDAFFIALYFKEDPIISIANSGVGEVLRVMAIDYGKMSLPDLKKLTEETIQTLKLELNLEFEKSKESTAPEIFKVE